MDTKPAGSVKIGSCSWNYPSWQGLVYSSASPTAVGFLPEYARQFTTAEVDSWFYKMPGRREVLDYMAATPPGFSFTVKVTEDISLTHKRNRGSKELLPNPSFLSRELFAKYLENIGPMLPQIDAVMLEFEYLNKDKMRDVSAFMMALDAFMEGMPESLPIAVETRNKNYLCEEYFQFLEARKIIHVFSEKLYMPHVYEVYDRFGSHISGTSVIRLLGGDRAEIEAKTQENWNRIVDEKADKPKIAEMSQKIFWAGGKLIISINNHYEGSAPLTARYFRNVLS